MAYGTVAWYDAQRGVGGIEPGGHGLAVHYSQIDGGGRQSLRPSDRVAFAMLDGPTDRHAVGIYSP
jgi:cold shock protein